MIKRIVRMYFTPGTEEKFLDVFNASSSKIRGFPGCTHLELWRDADDPGVFMTFSYWNSPEDLENYRNSALFKETWAKTKILFREKPVAFSVRTETVLS